ncbi:MAG TPA: hypothetical protein VJ907_08425 [Halanaerobiales bacterium]|nr:hypothetical protein [Halanaerobiales bacterium]
MRHKKRLIFLVLIIFAFTMPILALENEEKSNKIIKEFILKVYENYQQNKFVEVYEFMHPDIKDVLNKEEYLKFQKENTDKYNLKITEVEVLEINKLEEWVEPFNKIIKEKDTNELFEIKIKYKTIYKSAGNEKEKIIEKKTYVARDHNNNYLLWDPNIIK